MKALRFINKGLKLQEVARPEVPSGEALVRVRYAGICATDLEIVKGYMDFKGTLGHEFIGIVEDCDDLPEIIGQRVVGEINAACGNCEMCRKGLPNHCSDRTVLGISGRDGAFAEFLTLPAWNLHPVPDAVSDRAAVFAEPLAAAYEILDQTHLHPGDPILLIGDGRLAQLIVRVLARAGLTVDVVGQREVKLRRMKGFISRAFIGSAPPEDKYPVVVEGSGSPKGWQAALAAVQPRGTIILKSTYAGTMNWNPAPLVVNEVTVVGSRCGPFAPAMAALVGGLDPTPLIDREFTLEQWREAFVFAQQPDTLKVVFEMGGNVH